ncbi:hypothetical protein [Pseudoruegeria sp. HB172150]|uniref:hypothetical protein n=1 Tax=Pseudoruegeria sp. HB172150 TaxID=2721164 RepID=UPI0015557712|nr:hypothetical protein [Pseudoruegeria sp. HB172150]
MTGKYLALICTAAVLAGCAYDGDTVTRRNGNLPVSLQADLRGCEAQSFVAYPIDETLRGRIGYGAVPYEWACDGERCVNAETFTPIAIRDYAAGPRVRYVTNCMAELGYTRLVLPQCAPDEVPGSTYRLSSATEGACAARVKDDGWVAIIP